MHSERIISTLQHDADQVRVIVNLEYRDGVRSAVDWNSRSSVAQHQERIDAIRRPVLAALPPGEVVVRHRFDNLPAFSCETTQAGLKALLRDPRVRSIEPTHLLEAHVAQGIVLLNAGEVRAVHDGTGASIAVCDSGIDYGHPNLGSGGFPNDKVIGGFDFGDKDPDPMPNGVAHGTGCAGIAAGDLASAGDYIGGVAPGARLYALKVTYSTMNAAVSDDIIAAWDWCITHKNDNPASPILVISLSMGGGRFFGHCDASESAYAAAAANAVAAGITILASAGNSGYCESIASPACLTDVISVGAVYDAPFGQYLPCVTVLSCAVKYAGAQCATGYYSVDNSTADLVPSFANIAFFLDVLAPSNRACTTDLTGPAGYAAGDYHTTFGGTSAACAYAAGAVACLQSAAKATLGRYLAPAEVRNILVASGDAVVDPKIGITRPRINLGRAVATLDHAYCLAGGGCDEHIAAVQLGGIANASGVCDGYRDYTHLSTPLIRGIAYPLTVTNGRPSAIDQCGVWIDWNADNDFEDSDETLVVTGSPGPGPYIASVMPPLSTSAGTRRMRIRIAYAGELAPCGTTTYGEVEDYTVVVRESPKADIDRDGDVDGADFGTFCACFNGTGQFVTESCESCDLDGDLFVDGVDFGLFAACFNGAGNAPACL